MKKKSLTHNCRKPKEFQRTQAHTKETKKIYMHMQQMQKKIISPQLAALLIEHMILVNLTKKILLLKENYHLFSSNLESYLLEHSFKTF